MAKRGPKPKVTDEVKGKIYEMLRVGASLVDAADCLEIDRKTIYTAQKSDPKFATGVKKAIKDGKLRLVRKVGKAKPWQAAAWMLERKFGSEFGRKDRHEITGAKGKPIQTETTVTHVIDYDTIRSDLATFARSGPHHGGVPSNGNGKSVHPEVDHAN